VRILGIDPGSRYCGYGAVEIIGPRAVRYLECGVIEPPRTAPLSTRLAEIADELSVVFAELRPHAVAVEGVFHGVNARSALQLGQARGAALTAAGRAGLSVFEYAPATVKRAVAGNGAATKTQVAAMVRTLCKLSRAPRLDASDALAIAICHALRARRQLVP
jgi:crossover junction endodeoxyribonuclease RuvC